MRSIRPYGSKLPRLDINDVGRGNRFLSYLLAAIGLVLLVEAARISLR
jgi:hypothetical protein